VLGLVSVLAAVAVLWALWERRRGRRCARMHLAVSARLHEVNKRCAEERGRVDVLLLRLGRQVERGEGLRVGVAHGAHANAKHGCDSRDVCCVFHRHLVFGDCIGVSSSAIWCSNCLSDATATTLPVSASRARHAM
jgi:hypothetical protein